MLRRSHKNIEIQKNALEIKLDESNRSLRCQKTLIKKLKYYLDPIQDTLNTHTGRKIPKGKEIVGVSPNSTEKTNIALKKKGQFLYYSLGYNYYLVDKS